jgi:hypothetical protein
MAVMGTVYDTRPASGVSSALWAMYMCDPNARRWNSVSRLAAIRDAINELQIIVASLSATPVQSTPIEV